jgi:hypothetical protein
MEKDEALLAQFGDQLDRLAPGKEWKLDFRTLRDVLGTDTDDTAERAAKEFAMRHGFSFHHDKEQSLGIFTGDGPADF